MNKKTQKRNKRGELREDYNPGDLKPGVRGKIRRPIQSGHESRTPVPGYRPTLSGRPLRQFGLAQINPIGKETATAYARTPERR